MPEFQKCTVCFLHLYDRELPLGRVRDHDNMEEKHVLDVISNFFLVSDGGLHVDTCHITRMADRDATETGRVYRLADTARKYLEHVFVGNC